MLSVTDVTDVTDFSVYRHTRARAHTRMSVNGMIRNIGNIGNRWAESAHQNNPRLSASGGGVPETQTVASRQNRLPSHAEIKSRLIELEIKEGRKFNSTAQKKTYPIGYSAPSRDVTTTPPGGIGQVGTCRSETGWARNNPQSHIDVLRCSICNIGTVGGIEQIGAAYRGNRPGPTQSINRNIGGAWRDISPWGARGKIRAGHRGKRPGTLLSTLTQEKRSRYARGRARGKNSLRTERVVSARFPKLWPEIS